MPIGRRRPGAIAVECALAGSPKDRGKLLTESCAGSQQSKGGGQCQCDTLRASAVYTDARTLDCSTTALKAGMSAMANSLSIFRLTWMPFFVSPSISCEYLM